MLCFVKDKQANNTVTSLQPSSCVTLVFPVLPYLPPKSSVSFSLLKGRNCVLYVCAFSGPT